ncbi:IS30 family transposase [Microbulbifer sp. ZKSA006]|uniref:IS30 family transposase n=1 Tax=Microbulbifer sp. ZKSA006 TaxID=3243390 RepID=UPI0040399EE1
MAPFMRIYPQRYPLQHKDFVHIITAYNGKVFTLNGKTEGALDAKVYFAHPHSSWERDLNENTNDLLRQHFSKQTDFKLANQADIEATIESLNNRPRKTLDYPPETINRRIYDCR